jgi:L-ascorbate metabolism protein UlaG (beta-lactamase superfamily)
MKITKYEHSCLLVEMAHRTALFDPGAFSEQSLDVSKLEYLDDIFITHGHPDHLGENLIKQLVARFPDVRITGPQAVVDHLQSLGITASNIEPEGTRLLDAPHEALEPWNTTPPHTGYHYLDRLTHAGDSHHFTETMPILAVAFTAPWGDIVETLNLVFGLRPKYVLPIHDWFWKPEAKAMFYDRLQALCKEQDIEFIPLENGKPIVIDHADEQQSAAPPMLK